MIVFHISSVSRRATEKAMSHFLVGRASSLPVRGASLPRVCESNNAGPPLPTCAAGVGAQAQTRKSGRRTCTPEGPAGVPEREATSAKSNEPLRFAPLSVPRVVGGLGKEAITVLVPAAFLAEKRFLAPLRGPCGVELLLTPFPGVYACAPTPGYFLATLRVAVQFRDAARGQTSILDTLNKYPGQGCRALNTYPACPEHAEDDLHPIQNAKSYAEL